MLSSASKRKELVSELPAHSQTRICIKYKNTDVHPGENTKVPEYDTLTDTVHKNSVFLKGPISLSSCSGFTNLFSKPAWQMGWF